MPVSGKYEAIKRTIAPLKLHKMSLRAQLSGNPYKIDSNTDNIRFDVRHIPRGLYFISIKYHSNLSPMGPKLMTGRPDSSESPDHIYTFIRKDGKEMYGTVVLSDDIDTINFYPSRLPCELTVSDCHLRAINAFSRDYIYGQTYVRLKTFGWSWIIARLKEESKSALIRLLKGKTDDSYTTWWNLYGKVSKATLEKQRLDASLLVEGGGPKISIVLPVHNPPLGLLKKAVDSVTRQSYPLWELCICDDASDSKDILNYLKALQDTDTRIKIKFRDDNGHISAASNTALSLATGDYVGFLDHDDEITPNALFEVVQLLRDHPDTKFIYSDEDIIDELGLPINPHFKPDWNYDLATAINYVCHFMVIARNNIEQVDGFREGGYEGAQDFDLMLRVTEKLNKTSIRHIPKVLYHWRAIEGSTAQSSEFKPYTIKAGIKALSDHIQRNQINAYATESEIPTAYRINYQLPPTEPSVTLIIPTHNNLRILKNCLESIVSITEYNNYDILIIDNRSNDQETLDYLTQVQNEQIQVLPYDAEFNFSAINNFAVENTQSEIVVLLNNDTEVCTPDWLSEMVSHAIRPNVGAVGAKLFYAEDYIQHAGVLLGMGSDKVAGHAFKGFHKHEVGALARTRLTQEYCAVTAACLAVRRDKYLEAGGLDAENLPIAFNDVDFCLKLRQKGYANIWTPYAQLYHYESISRGYDISKEKRARFVKERDHMQKKWGAVLEQDPFYNPNLTREFDNYTLAWPPYEYQQP